MKEKLLRKRLIVALSACAFTTAACALACISSHAFVLSADEKVQFEEVVISEQYGVGDTFILKSTNVWVDGEEVHSTAALLFGFLAALISRGKPK